MSAEILAWTVAKLVISKYALTMVELSKMYTSKKKILSISIKLELEIMFLINLRTEAFHILVKD